MAPRLFVGPGIDMKPAITIVFLIAVNQAFCQSDNEDSLLNFWQNEALHDSTRIQALEEYVFIIISENPDSAFRLAHSLIELAGTRYPVQQAWGYYGQANASLRMGSWSIAIKLYEAALTSFTVVDNKPGIAAVYNDLSIIQRQQGNYEYALDYLNTCLLLRLEIGNDKTTSGVYNNIGNVYADMGLTDSALYYYNISLSIRLTEKMTDKISETHQNIGALYSDLSFSDSAIHYFEEALKYQKDDSHNGAIVCYNLGLEYLSKNEIQLALYYAEKSVQYAETCSDLVRLMDAQELLYRCYKEQNREDLALLYHEAYTLLKDSISNLSINKEVLASRFEIEYLAMRVQDSLKNQHELEINNLEHQSELQSQTHLRNYLYAGTSALFLLAAILYSGYRRKTKTNKIIAKQKHLVEEKNQEITDSISYAKRIQEAILPPARIVNQYLPNSFLLYKPKDIVAGDFYWMEKVDDTILFAAADCTGHGVPGAMVSVVCHNAMNRAVREFGLSEPGKILDKTNELVEETFIKSDEEVKDGMDIALCSLTGNTLQYAGAHNPLWIIRNGEIIETKADKQPIGSFNEHRPSATNTFELQPNDSLYIFSDGFVDQFGGEKGKKYKARAFRELLLSVQDQPMAEQKMFIEDTFEKWRGELEQVDDVCVIGVRFTE